MIFFHSLSCLDNKRLGKQRVEAFQLLVALEDPWALEERFKRTGKKETKGWKNHPAALMWKYNIAALKAYYNTSLSVWKLRNFSNTMAEAHIFDIEWEYPSWIGNKEFHLSHQSNLLRKDFNHYSKFFSRSSCKFTLYLA